MTTWILYEYDVPCGRSGYAICYNECGEMVAKMSVVKMKEIKKQINKLTEDRAYYVKPD